METTTPRTSTTEKNIPREETKPTSRVKRASSFTLKKQKKWHVNSMGEVIFKDHPSFEIMRQIQMGIRTSISYNSFITSHIDSKTLQISDFSETDKLYFPNEGSSKTPPHEYSPFTFYTYCAKPFRDLRLRFGIEPQHYLTSLCHDASLAIIKTPGKSGALFFFSLDMKYILKTVTKKESKYLRKILPQYYHHVMKNPSTLIAHFYGMYAIKPKKSGKNVRFVVMNNVFDTHFPILEKYDLKGSTIGRSTVISEEKPRENIVFKDLDFLERRKTIRVKPDLKQKLLKQLQVDCDWLESMKIMDYSLLLGISNLNAVYDEKIETFGTSVYPKEMTLKMDKESDSEKTNEDSSIEEKKDSTPTLQVEDRMRKRKSIFAKMRKSREIILHRPQRTYYSDFKKFHGGILSTQNDSGDQEVYFMAIIDILQEWNNKKQIENFVKGFTHNKTQISAVNPKLYSKRFQAFIASILEESETTV